MTTIQQEHMDVERNDRSPSALENNCVPRQLMEASELLSSIDRRLEDCALEWQAGISRKQWKAFNSKTIGENLSERSILARTYFVQKDRDEAFQHLLSCNKIFAEYLKNFIGLLRGEEPALAKETCDAQNQWSDPSEACKPSDPFVESLHLSPLRSERSTKTGNRSSLVNNLLSVQNSFADLIKAKVNFDTKFLGFEAVLHKSASAPTNSTRSCQHCCNADGILSEEQRRFRGANVGQRSKVARTKRLTRSTRTLAKRRGRKSPISIGDVGDLSAVAGNENYNNATQT